jgi:hypothetical protein
LKVRKETFWKTAEPELAAKTTPVEVEPGGPSSTRSVISKLPTETENRGWEPSLGNMSVARRVSAARLTPSAVTWMGPPLLFSTKSPEPMSTATGFERVAMELASTTPREMVANGAPKLPSFESDPASETKICLEEDGVPPTVFQVKRLGLGVRERYCPAVGGSEGQSSS